jgi:hypothetical protein
MNRSLRLGGSLHDSGNNDSACCRSSFSATIHGLSEFRAVVGRMYGGIENCGSAKAPGTVQPRGAWICRFGMGRATRLGATSFTMI